MVKPFDPGHGRLMKEWLTVTSAKASWIDLADGSNRPSEGPEIGMGRPAPEVSRRGTVVAGRPRARGRPIAKAPRFMPVSISGQHAVSKRAAPVAREEMNANGSTSRLRMHFPHVPVGDRQ
jgi:hypothetical protein